MHHRSAASTLLGCGAAAAVMSGGEGDNGMKALSSPAGIAEGRITSQAGTKWTLPAAQVHAVAAVALLTALTRRVGSVFRRRRSTVRLNRPRDEELRAATARKSGRGRPIAKDPGGVRDGRPTAAACRAGALRVRRGPNDGDGGMPSRKPQWEQKLGAGRASNHETKVVAYETARRART
jgi:hypothetical protein